MVVHTVCLVIGHQLWLSCFDNQCVLLLFFLFQIDVFFDITSEACSSDVLFEGFFYLLLSLINIQ